MNLLNRYALPTIAAALATLGAPALMGVPSAAAHAQTYTVKNLGVLPGHASSCAKAVNDLGQVVGYSTNSAGTRRAFLWTPGGTAGSSSNPQMQDLGTLNGGNVSAVDINNAGQIILTGANNADAGIWDASNGLRSMNDPSVSNAAILGWTNVSPRRINDVGQVIGMAYSPADGVNHAFLWTPTAPNGSYGTLTDLGQPYGYRFFSPMGINNQGQIVGDMAPLVGSGGVSRLFRWTPVDPVTGAFSPNSPSGVYTDLGALSPTSTYGQDINDTGEITGIFYNAAGYSRGFARDAFGGTSVLNPLSSQTVSSAFAIGNASQVVGNSSVLGTGLNCDVLSGWRSLAG